MRHWSDTIYANKTKPLFFFGLQKKRVRHQKSKCAISDMGCTDLGMLGIVKKNARDLPCL